MECIFYQQYLLDYLQGSLSDKIGCQTLIIGCSILFISMILIGQSKSIEMYTVSALLFGVATGISSPTLFAWTADLSPDHRRGIGAGTIFIALELGIMMGSFSTMLLYKSTFNSVSTAFTYGGIVSAIAVFYY